MKIEGKNNILMYLVICLVMTFANKTDEMFLHDKGHDYQSFASEILDPATDIQLNTDNYSFSAPENQCRVPRQTNFTNFVRTVSQGCRQNASSHSRHGFTLMKSGKSMNEYTTNLFFVSIRNFPSGMNEANNHLISLRKLII